MSQYSPTLIKHFSEPKNVGELEDATVKAVVSSPICGDQLHLFARISDGKIIRCSYLAHGCAGSMAIGSLLTETIQGRSVNEISEISEADLVTLIGGLTPAQRHCATLAKEALVELVTRSNMLEVPTTSHQNAPCGCPSPTDPH